MYQTLPGEFVFISLVIARWWSGLILRPLTLSQAFLFYSPGLYVNELNTLPKGTSMAFLFFFAGCIYCYRRTLPRVVTFFSGWGAKIASANWTLVVYAKLVFLLSSFTNYLLQIPLLQTLGVAFNNLTGTELLEVWRKISVWFITLAAIITPSTDPWVQSVISTYLLSIYLPGASIAFFSGS